MLWVTLAIVGAVVLWTIVMYNRLIGLRNQVLNGWRQIDVQLKRRHDLIPNLVNTVRGAMEFERDTLTQVMEARARAVSAAGPLDAARKEGDGLRLLADDARFEMQRQRDLAKTRGTLALSR